MHETDLTVENQNLAEKKLVIIQQLSNLGNLVDNPVAISNLVLDIATQHIGAGKCSLMMRNDRNELYIIAARGFDDGVINKYRVKIGEATKGAMEGNCLPVCPEDGEKSGSRNYDCHYEKALISCPIIRKNKLLGILNLHDKRGDFPFSAEEYELAQVIANHAGIAIDNLLLVNQLKIKAAELEMTNQKLMDMDLTRTEFLMSLSHELRSPLNAIKGSIYHLDQTDNIEVDERKEFYGIIRSETDKVLSFVESQLDFLISGDLTRQLNMSLIDLAETLKEFSESPFLVRIKKKKSLKLLLDAKNVTSSICGDKTKITQFFQYVTEGLSFFLKKDDTLRLTVDDGDFIHIRFLIPGKLPEAQIPDLFRISRVRRKNEDEHRIKFCLAKKINDLHHWSMTASNTDDNFQLSIVIPKNKRQKIDVAVKPSANLLLEIISESLGLDICSLLLNDDFTDELTIKGALGLGDEVIRNTRIKVGDKISGWVALEGEPLLIDNIENDPRFGKISSTQYNTKSLVAIPLKVNGKVIGVLNMNNKKSGRPFTEKDLNLATVIVERFSHIMAKLYGNEVREKDVEQLLSSLSGLLHAQKKYNKKQALFTDLVVQIMDRMKVSEEEKLLALYVATIYDLGLTLLNPELLNKKKLQMAERNALRIHPHTALDLLNNFEFSEEVKKAILHHHERFDGSGYPDGLQGERIPVISRVIAVVDAFCAMISTRPYRDRISIADALQEIRNGSGTFYDPDVVDALEEALIRGSIEVVMRESVKADIR